LKIQNKDIKPNVVNNVLNNVLNNTGNVENVSNQGEWMSLYERNIKQQMYEAKHAPAYLLDSMPKADKVVKDNPNNYVGNALVILTEAPLYNILEWASKIYRRDGKILKQVQTGSYEEKVWKSVLFQMLVIIKVLVRLKINMNNFDLDKNLFIKELKESGQNIRYWKYNINGIDFYVPNYGYLVLFDVNFDAPTEKGQKLLFENTEQKKIYDKMFDVNKFTSTTFLANGGNKPPDSILKLIPDIKSKDILQIDNTFISHFGEFLNNRIGTPLNEFENKPENKQPHNNNLHKGDICVYNDGNISKFVLCISSIDTNNNIKIYNGKSIEELSINELSIYPKTSTLTQKVVPNEPTYNEDEMLEMYIL